MTARLGSTEGDGPAPIDAEARTGVDRLGRRDGPRRPGAVLAADQTLAQRAGATTPIASVVPRQRVRVAGRVKSVRVQPRAGTSNLECVLSDGTGGCWSSRAGPGSPGSSRAPASWSRGWWAPGDAVPPCSIPPSSWSRGRRTIQRSPEPPSPVDGGSSDCRNCPTGRQSLTCPPARRRVRPRRRALGPGR